MISEDSIEKLHLLLEQLVEDMKQVGISDDDLDALFAALDSNINEPTPFRAWIIVQHLDKFEKCLWNQINRGEHKHRKMLMDIRYSIQYLTSGILNDMIMNDDVMPDSDVTAFLDWLKRVRPEEHNLEFQMCLEKDPNNPVAYTVKHHIKKQTPHYLTTFIEKTQDDDFELLALSGIFTIQAGTKAKVFQVFKELIMDRPGLFGQLARFFDRRDLDGLVDLLAGGNETLKRTFLSSLSI